MSGARTSPARLDGVELRAPRVEDADVVVSSEALAFVAALEREFRDRRAALLRRRLERQATFDAGVLPSFGTNTRRIREDAWKVAAAPRDLLDRRVEITGPADRKTIVNALKSGARVFMADFEDALSPTWTNCVFGQRALREATRRQVDFTSPEGRRYRLDDATDPLATLMVRPRGWHLHEKHLLVDGRPASAALFDFGLDFFHNARERIDRGSGPYYYLPKIESHLEARLWNDVFGFAQDALAVRRGSIRATVLIETLPAAFEMNEILWELRDHSAGLNCGRWDYLFSAIKKLRSRPEWVTPDRAQMTMAGGFLRAYSQLLIQTCHRRGAHAMGGMAAQVPIKDDPRRNDAALEKVRLDKEREVGDGHDGTWVAHPGLVALATRLFDERMAGPNQLGVLRDDVVADPKKLLEPPKGPITHGGLEIDVSVGLRYLEPWLRGVGCVPLDHLMEDAATAEICRTQLWQWIRHGARLEDGRTITLDLFRNLLVAELEAQRSRLGAAAFAATRFEAAATLLDRLVAARELPDFLTIPAYERLE
jgi:malate synthase